MKKKEEEIRIEEIFSAIGKTASTIAHKLKNPLTAIKMNVDLLEKVMDEGMQRTQSIEIINKEIQQLNTIIGTMLHSQNSDELDYTIFRVSHLIQDCLKAVGPYLATRSINVSTILGDEQLEGDYNEVRDAFLNLITNSIEAIGHGGTIDISNVKENADDRLTIYFKDSGSGIAPTTNVFQPFYSTKATGSGLGLSIAKRIIEKHHGSLALHSSQPGETIFSVSLPKSQG
jgi:two-component system sensor histidine kinase HydH